MGDAVYVAISHLTPQDDAQRALKTQAANLMVQLGRASRTHASAGGFIGFKAVADRADLVARGDLLWL